MFNSAKLWKENRNKLIFTPLIPINKVCKQQIINKIENKQEENSINRYNSLIISIFRFLSREMYVILLNINKLTMKTKLYLQLSAPHAKSNCQAVTEE